MLGNTIMPTREAGIFTIPEIATYLKVTEKTIYRLAGTRQIPAFKVGGSWRFSKAEITAWIARESSRNLTSQQHAAVRRKPNATTERLR
jgi:excisionase family DNA binding protein